ncbi:hypothetical protein [Stygiolobus azoricus]|uniref:Uncharacterized protein n=1 Tax=Stygiolobus azoricus TaxID=41675 RepID=A0A650CLA3_9CREN|nr:hypothetical protein [Stygiolobus azoricus]QGR18654.1 hypothetical protein D1868_00670 [Stygiolobus azoricus]
MLKYAEYVRHGLGEPIGNVNVYKKVEDGKVIAILKVVVYKNQSFAIYETDKLEGGEVVEILPNSMTSIIRIIEKYYDPKVDDITVLGEKKFVDDFLEEFNKLHQNE